MMIDCSPVSFGASTGLFSGIERKAAGVLNGLAHTDTMKKLTEYADKPSRVVDISGNRLKNIDGVFKKHMPAIYGLWIVCFYVLNNLTSPDIPHERKIPLALNDIITGIFAATAGYTIVNGFKALQFGLEERLMQALPFKEYLISHTRESIEFLKADPKLTRTFNEMANLAGESDFTSSVMKKVSQAMKNLPANADKSAILSTVAGQFSHKEYSKELIGNFVNFAGNYTEKMATLKSGIGLMMGLFAFTFVFRYLGPVFATPCADKLNKLLIKHKIITPPPEKPITPDVSVKTLPPRPEGDYLTVLHQYFRENKLKNY